MTGSDHSGWYRSMSGAVATLVVAATLTIAPQHAGAVCTGDCDGNTAVTVNELMTMVNIALGTAPVSTCTPGDQDGNGAITVNEILTGVNNALNGCPACGNGVVDDGEECDNGGTCIGGTNAGTPCRAESECQGDGVCLDGTKGGWGCSTNADCPGSSCIHCKPFGGKGCAANCTMETDVNITLVPGENGADNTTLTEGTSGLVANSEPITLAIPFLPNNTRQLTIGKEKDGKIPAVLKVATNQPPAIDILVGQGCLCIRSVALKTCGGTVWEKDGTLTTDCNAGYTAGDSVCPAAKPCTFAFGPDNAGGGDVGCNGLDGVNVATTQDSGGSSSPVDTCGGSGVPGPGPVLTTRTGTGGPGAAVLLDATELGFLLASCEGDGPDYGADGRFCTSDDPQAGRRVLPQVLTTGTASAMVARANCDDGKTIGPFMSHGAVLSCSTLATGSASGGALAGAFPNLNQPVIMDMVVTSVQVAQ